MCYDLNIFCLGNALLIGLVISCRFFQQATSDCQNIIKKSTVTARVASPVLKAKKLLENLYNSEMDCVFQCLNEDGCLYVTLSRITRTCSLYAVGPTAYNLNSLETYVLEFKDFKVIIRIIRSSTL